ncbi:hypothetical protein [Tichowtungia aerotolerans]|uniref:Uncharacterized protein n=1 Tax=Tichowtungia aerotolerans TaxID=2697043 RepID=A0A6P1MFR2_9BACT|nr:hypothetical protein [Tichowtungia aerotolerans]QHI69915.1 hypothetical protein GT409_10785 [Tichowtungia aerotolerans]
MKENEIQKSDGMSIAKREDLVASIPKDEFKSWFYLLSGKPDSTVKFFSNPIIVGPSDIEDLNNAVQDKLRTHHVEGCITSITINYRNNTVKEFSTWAEFQTHNWKRPEVTETIFVKWDFMVDMPNFEVPQRHTMTLRIANEIKPAHVLNALFGGGQTLNNWENLENEMSPVYCRVDFINQSLGQELVNLVNDWYKGKRKVKHIGRFMQVVSKQRRIFSQSIHYSIPLLTGALACALMFYRCEIGNCTDPLTVSASKWLFLWLLISIFVISIAGKIGEKVSSSVFKSLSGYGEGHYFNFTNGDKNQQEEKAGENKKKLIRLWSKIILTALFDIALAIFTTKLIK